MKAGRRRDIYREEMRGNWAPVPRRSSPSPLRPFLGPKQKRRVLKSLPRCQPQPQLRFLYHLSPCPVAASSPLCALALFSISVSTGNRQQLQQPCSKCSLQQFLYFLLLFISWGSEQEEVHNNNKVTETTERHAMPQHTIYLHTYYMYVCLKHTQHQAASDGLLKLAERWKIKITAPVSCRLLPFFVAFSYLFRGARTRCPR